MIGVALTVGFLATFGAGFASAWLVWVTRLRNRAYMERAIENARIRGQLERPTEVGSTPPPHISRSR
jgi:hypothetical protein